MRNALQMLGLALTVTALVLIWIPARPAGDRLLLNARGAVAWPSWLPNNQVDVIYDAEDRDHEYGARVLRVADTGAIHPESLRLTSD